METSEVSPAAEPSPNAGGASSPVRHNFLTATTESGAGKMSLFFNPILNSPAISGPNLKSLGPDPRTHSCKPGWEMNPPVPAAENVA